MLHPGAGSVLGTGCSSFLSASVAALEPQFASETGVGVDNDAKAHSKA